MNKKPTFRPAMPANNTLESQDRAATLTVNPQAMASAVRINDQGAMAALGTFPAGHRNHPHYHGFCHGCGHPAHLCCCHHPHCRSEAKELLVEPMAWTADKKSALVKDELTLTIATMASTMLEKKSSTVDLSLLKAMTLSTNAATVAGTANTPAQTIALGLGSGFIGGGCCVHLSIEYMPYNVLADANALVIVGVMDSDATLMTWAKVIGAQSGYQIKEDIITTFAGARLVALCYNMIARVRWCEVFSC